jgi:hypothetical protein
MERGNADLLLFLLILAAIHLRHLPLVFRLAGYGLIILGGLVKFYPFMALIMVLRERPAVIVAVGGASIIALSGMALLYYDELALMAANLPAPSYFMLQFGSANLPAGMGITVDKVLAKYIHLDVAVAHATGTIVRGVLLPSLTLSAIAGAILIGRRCQLPTKIAQLPAGETDFLVTAAALIGGCYFAGQSVVYRGIYLLLALPGLAELSRRMQTTHGRRLFVSVGIAIAFVLWTPFLDECLVSTGLTPRLVYQGVASRIALIYKYDPYENFPGFTLGYLVWLIGELAWWWVVTLLLSVLGAFVVRTETWWFVCRTLRLPDGWAGNATLPGQPT